MGHEDAAQSFRIVFVLPGKCPHCVLQNMYGISILLGDICILLYT